MARSRNIKPALFSNDTLAEIDPIGRLLFIGLWTIADFKGDIEWREKRIKAQLVPYDECDVKNIAINLDKLGFIRFYSDGDLTYINITNFSKHQNPHKNEREKGSEIPAYSETMRQAIDLKGLTINPDKSRLNQDENGTNPADSLNLIPDPLIPIKDDDRQANLALLENAFEHLWKGFKKCKATIGVTDTSPKAKTFEKTFKKIFNSQYFKSHNELEFKAEINLMCEFCKKAHSTEGFNRFKNMQLPKFLNEKQWRD